MIEWQSLKDFISLLVWSKTHNFFYKQLGFQSEPGVAYDFSSNEAKSCQRVATFLTNLEAQTKKTKK